MIKTTPLAELLRPKTMDEFLGQDHLVGKDSILRKNIESGHLPSIILWGPPGVGKTTLANLIAGKLNMTFFTLSAISSGVKDVRNVINKANDLNGNVLLFIDEIHRFSKSQQDSLLGAVEKGVIKLIGATTENPSFEVISPLLSRCQVYILKGLKKEDLLILLKKATDYIKNEFGKNILFKENDAILRVSGGDARKLLNAVELIANSFDKDNIEVNNKTVIDTIQNKLAIYDKDGEMHYDIISAFIKSVRGSDPNATVYWLARMIEGGEDPKFIARRLIILASEDIGNANPNALLLANNCFEAVSKIGMPESRIILSQTAIYLATSPKSNSAYMAINNAQKLVKEQGNLSVPLHIRNAPTKLMKEIGYAKDYKYAHSFQGNFVYQEFLPEKITSAILYEPSNNPRENEIREKLKKLWGKKYNY